MKIKKGCVVVNVDGYVGKVTNVSQLLVWMEYKKCGKDRTESWNKQFVRLADESEIEDYKNEVKEELKNRRTRKA